MKPDNSSAGEDKHTHGSCFSRVACVVTVSSAFLINCSMGIVYSFGNINPYLTSYLRNSTGDASLDYTDTFWIPQTQTAAVCVLMPGMGLISTKVNLRLFLFVGILFTAATWTGMCWAVQQSLPLTIVAYGVIGAFPHAMLVPAYLNLAARWVPHRQGFVTGIVLAGYGVGALMWNQLTTWYINPHNLQPDVIIDEDRYYSQTSVLERVPDCLLLLAAIFTGIQLYSLIFMCIPPPPKITLLTSEPVDEESTTLISTSLTEHLKRPSCSTPIPSAPINSNIQDSTEPEERRQYHPKEVLKSRVFWTLWLCQFFVTQANLCVINLFKAYGQTFITDDHFLSLVASLSGIANAACRPFWGLLMDKIGYRMVALLAQCLLGCLVATFVTCEVTGRVTYFVWVIGMFTAICGMFTAIVTMTFALFGSKYFNAILGLNDTHAAMSAVLSAVTTPYLKGYFGWHGMFFFGFAYIFIGILLNISLDFPCGQKIPKDMHVILSLQR